MTPDTAATDPAQLPTSWNQVYTAAHDAWTARARSMTNSGLLSRYSLMSVRANGKPNDAGLSAAVTALLAEIERRRLVTPAENERQSAADRANYGTLL